MLKEKEIFKKLLQEKKYKDCSDIVKNKIINYIIKRIKEKNNTYEYLTIEDLIEKSRQYIDDEDKYIAELIEVNSFKEEPIDELERLMELCEKFKIK